jgi:hypothetical protein
MEADARGSPHIGTYGDLVDELLEFELAHGLFETTAEGVHVWEWLRMPVTRVLATETGVTPETDSRVERMYRSYLRGLGDWLRYSVYRNPMFGPETDVLFFGHSRRKRWRDDEWWDIYTDPVSEQLDSDSVTVEHPYRLEHRTPAKTETLYYLDFVRHAPRILNALGVGTPSLSEQTRTELRDLEDAFKTGFGVTIDLIDRVRQTLLDRRVGRQFYGRVLDRLDPEIVVLVCSYGKETFVETCRERSVPVVELQHGIVHPQHTGYAYPGDRDKKTFPDYFFTFGEFWCDVVEYPVADERLVPVGYPYFDEAAAEFEDVVPDDKILVLSQPVAGERLARFAVELDEQPSLGYDIVFKPHPKCGDRWAEEYPVLTDTTVDVVESGDKQLYELFAESRVQVGASSTALYEGLDFDLDTYVVDTPSVSAVKPLLSLDHVHLVEDAEEFLEVFSPRTPRIDTERFFRPGSLERVERELEQLRTDGSLAD